MCLPTGTGAGWVPSAAFGKVWTAVLWTREAGLVGNAGSGGGGGGGGSTALPARTSNFDRISRCAAVSMVASPLKAASSREGSSRAVRMTLLPASVARDIEKLLYPILRCVAACDTRAAVEGRTLSGRHQQQKGVPS